MKKDCLLLNKRIPGQYYRSKGKSISNSLSFRSVQIKPPEHIRIRTGKRAVSGQRLRAAGTLDAQLRILHAKDMQQAVELARQCAQPGDIVSLSPACASFDLYPDFEARGRHFKELVHQL